MAHKNSVYKRNSAGEAVVNTVAEAGIAKEVAATGLKNDRLYTGNPATRQSFTWAAGTGPTSIFMKVVALKIATGASPAVLVTFDAATDLLANLALAATGSAIDPILHEIVELNDGWVRQDFSAPLERLDFITAYGAVVEFRVKGV